MYKETDKLHFRSKCNQKAHCWYLDHMASKPIPKFRKEKADMWAKDHLLLHLAGAFRSRDDAIHYAIYPEMVSEQGNTILTQIDNILRKARENQLWLHETSFIMDNHKTQKNFTVLAYFEWLAKTNFISDEGICKSNSY